MTLEESRGECMRLKAFIASLENKIGDIEKYAQYTEGLYMEMKARVMELENS